MGFASLLAETASAQSNQDCIPEPGSFVHSNGMNTPFDDAVLNRIMLEATLAVPRPELVSCPQSATTLAFAGLLDLGHDELNSLLVDMAVRSRKEAWENDADFTTQIHWHRATPKRIIQYRSRTGAATASYEWW